MMKCRVCQFKRSINLPYRKEFDDIVCCHPDIAIESGWQFAGKIIKQDGANPSWCPLISEPCKHLRNTNNEFWCNGIEYFWRDCSKITNQYKVDNTCHDMKLIDQQMLEKIKQEIKQEKMHEELIKENNEFGC